MVHQEIEDLARYLCKRDGQDPDAVVFLRLPHGKKKQEVLWRLYVSVARGVHLVHAEPASYSVN